MQTKNQISITRKTLYGIMLLAILFAAFGTGSLPVVRAQTAGTATPTPDSVQQGESGTWYMTEGAQAMGAVTPLSVGGLDKFGYTWDDTASFNWIDVTGGVNTGLTGTSWEHATEAITLPFPFKYYGNT
jgi:hypothetical protein